MAKLSAEDFSKYLVKLFKDKEVTVPLEQLHSIEGALVEENELTPLEYRFCPKTNENYVSRMCTVDGSAIDIRTSVFESGKKVVELRAYDDFYDCRIEGVALNSMGFSVYPPSFAQKKIKKSVMKGSDGKGFDKALVSNSHLLVRPHDEPSTVYCLTPGRNEVTFTEGKKLHALFDISSLDVIKNAVLVFHITQ